MSTTLTKIEIKVPLTIFNGEVPRISEKVASIFNATESDFNKRYNEIIAYLKKKFPEDEITPELSKDNILSLFKTYFFEEISAKAMSRCFSSEWVYNDIVTIIRSLLTVENLKTAILGEPMINAFSDAIRKQRKEENSGFGIFLNGSRILLLENEFLGKNYLKGLFLK